MELDETIDLDFVDPAYARAHPTSADAYATPSEVVTLAEKKRTFVRMLRWLMDCSVGWVTRPRRLLNDCNLLPEAVAPGCTSWPSPA